MKRILLISLLLLAFIFTVSADRRRMLMTRNVAAATCTTIQDQNSSVVTGSLGAGSDVSAYYTGQQDYDPGATFTGCKISAVLSASGTISGKTIVMKVWSQTGTALNAVLYTSASVTGNNSWSQTVVDFDFSSTPISWSNGTLYSITIDFGGTDASNYVPMHYTASGGLTGVSAIWTSAGVRSTFLSSDIKLVIYK